MEKFKKLGLSDNFLKAIDEMHFKEPTEIQEKAIPLALAGKDIIGGSATGSGKTLAFGASILETVKKGKGIQALIMTPTRELAEQISTALRQFSKYLPCNIISVYGGMDIEKQIRQLATADIVVGTPGRIQDHLNRRTLNLTGVKHLVLDEVDRMFDMGFQHDVERILEECPKDKQTMLFSATISSEIDHLSSKHTKNPVEVSVESYIDASKLKQIYYDVPNNLKFSLLVKLLKQENADLVMVFSNTRRNADFIVNNLKPQGIDAQAIHGGLTQNKRNRTLEGFHKGHVNVLVCTDVAARGIDIKGVSHVYNFDTPKTAQEYIHRVGRTARAGEEGVAISLVSDRDYENFQKVNQDESLTIERLELPYVERLELRIDRSGRGSGRFGNSRGRSSERSGGGRRAGGRSHSFGGFGRSNRDSRREGGERTISRGDSRRNSNSREGGRDSRREGGRDSRGYSRGRNERSSEGYSRSPRSRDARNTRDSGDDRPRSNARGPSRDSRGLKRGLVRGRASTASRNGRGQSDGRNFSHKSRSSSSNKSGFRGSRGGRKSSDGRR